jgi:hypothetical protein
MKFDDAFEDLITMKLSLKTVKTAAILCGMLTVAAMTAQTAQAAPVNFDGNYSYLGGGGSIGVTNGGAAPGTAQISGGNIQGRFAVPGAPISVRGTVLFTNNNSAIIPTLTYDKALGKGIVANAGVGYSFVQNAGVTSPLGNRNAFVLTAGLESEVTKGVIVYTDAKYGSRAYTGSPASAVSLQAGVGLKF